MSDKEKTLFASLAVAAIGCLAYWAYDAQVRVDEYNTKVNSLTESVQAMSAKQLADQESNLKDLEDNKVIEAKVIELESKLVAQQAAIDELTNKLLKKKK
jgi:uncharacterized coiled-coil protein SlyX